MLLQAATFALLVCGQVAEDPQPVESQHFYVYCDDAKLGEEVSRNAERFREEIIKEWSFGKKTHWPYPHIVQVSDSKAQHGSNQWVIISNIIKVGGQHDEMIYGSLRHEITHSVIMTTHGLRIPLWAGEGIAMFCEKHPDNNIKILDFAGDDPLIEMFTARDYPLLFEHRFYGKALSVTTWLVEMKGKKTFVDFVGDGNVNGWESAVTKWYDFKTINDMQVAWGAWHKKHYGKPLRKRTPR